MRGADKKGGLADDEAARRMDERLVGEEAFPL